MWKSLNLELSASTDFALPEVFFYILNVESAEISRWNHYFKCENVLYVTCLQRAEELEREDMEELYVTCLQRAEELEREEAEEVARLQPRHKL